MRCWTLGSGSQGNAMLVEHDGHRVLVDAGFRLPELVERLNAIGVPPATVDDVVLTHGHRDHVLGAADGAAIYGWRLWGTLGTVWRWRALREVPLQGFEAGGTWEIGRLRVRSAPTPHNVDDSAAIVVEGDDEDRDVVVRAAYCTDLGHVTPPVDRLLEGVDLLLLEFNYDPELLRAGPYPPPIKEHVAGPVGHLSNAQAGALLRRVAHPGLRHVLLGHVSRHNNTPALALEAAREAVRGTAFTGTIAVAPQDEPSGPYDVREAHG